MVTTSRSAARPATAAALTAQQWQVDAWVATCTAVAADELAGVSPHVPEFTGHPATSLAQLLRARH